MSLIVKESDSRVNGITLAGTMVSFTGDTWLVIWNDTSDNTRGIITVTRTGASVVLAHSDVDTELSNLSIRGFIASVSSGSDEDVATVKSITIMEALADYFQADAANLKNMNAAVANSTAGSFLVNGWEAITYSVDDLIGDGQNLYKCNTAGAQTGNFSTNILLWDSYSVGGAPAPTLPSATTLTASGTGRTGDTQQYVVPAGVVSLQIETWGAQGGTQINPSETAGQGAYVRATYDVTPGQVLLVRVGHVGSGTTNAGAGGGGTFVVQGIDTLVQCAGGGAGSTNGYNGQDGRGGENGGGPTTSSGGQGGAATDGGAGGAGFSANGQDSGWGTGGFSWANGSLGAVVIGGSGGQAGFGGGGGQDNGGNVSGGGGGYSGGAGNGNGTSGGGGGGSYFGNGTSAFTQAGGRVGSGQAKFTPLALELLGPAATTMTASGTGRNGTTQEYVVPSGVTSLRIETWGAQGGDASGNVGGAGAYVNAIYAVTPGQTLFVRVGQQGGTAGNGSSSGGGGTFVVGAGDTLIQCAGGGGGSSNIHNGGPGRSTNNGGGLTTSSAGGGGESTTSGGFGGGGGAGFIGGGFDSSNGQGGENWSAGSLGGDGTGGTAGGFGGGGSHTNGGSTAGGGGGGYCGGAGGGSSDQSGGAGSFMGTGTAQEGNSGVRSGHGQARFTPQ